MERDECPGCFEEVGLVLVPLGGTMRRVEVELAEVEVIGEDGNVYRGHERHWKYCTARPQTGSESAAPPEDVDAEAP